MVHAGYCAPYPKVPCVRYGINMQCTCCMISLFLEPSTSFYVSCDLTLSSKNRKMKINQI